MEPNIKYFDNNQNHKLKKWKWGLIIAPLILILFGVLFFQTQWGRYFSLRSLMSESRHKILFETNHEALLQSCRQELASRNAQGTTKLDYDDPKIPKSLKFLNPCYVVMAPNKIRADLYMCKGDCAHFGFVAFAPNFKPTTFNDLIDTSQYGHPTRKSLNDGAFEIIPGLWYYDTTLGNRSHLQDSFKRYYQNQYKQK